MIFYIFNRQKNPEQKFLPKIIGTLKNDHRDFLIFKGGNPISK